MPASAVPPYSPVSGRPRPARRGRLRALARMSADLTPLRESGQFRLLASSRTVTFIGTQATEVALLVQVQQMTGSALLTGLLGATEILPMVAFGLVGGVLADRLDRRMIAAATEAGLGVVAVLLAVNAMAPRPMLWPVYACAALAMALAALQRPSLDAAVPRLLPRGQLAAAAALMSVGTNIGAIAGPAVGGLLATGPGPGAVYVLDSASYLISLGLLARLRLPGSSGDRTRAATSRLRASGLREILAGLAYPRRRPDLLGSYIVDFAAMLLAYPVSLYPFLAARLHARWAVGLMFSAGAVGALLASATSGWSARAHRHGRVIAAAAAAWGLCMVGLGLAPGIGVTLAILVVAGGFDEISAIFRDTFWNQTIPDRLRGRLAGVEMLSYGLGPSAGQARAGAMARLLGVRTALWSGGLLCVAAVGATCLALPALVRYDSRSAQPPDGGPEEPWHSLRSTAAESLPHAGDRRIGEPCRRTSE
jgi:MFS family permease